MRIRYFADIRFPIERANGVQTMETCHALARRGLRVGLLDADVYGPSIPTMLGAFGRPDVVGGNKVRPVEAHGIRFISMGLLVDDSLDVNKHYVDVLNKDK